mgnify:CR=1 FL=1
MTTLAEEVVSDLDLAIALELSAPNSKRRIEGEKQFVVEGYSNETLVRIPRSVEKLDTGRVLVSKETIALALKIGDLWRRNRGDVEPRHSQAAVNYGRYMAETQFHNRNAFTRKPEAEDQGLMMFREFFGVDDSSAEDIDDRTSGALKRLESMGLVVDPAILDDGLIVLVGLVPVSWSVRTKPGEEIAREVRVRAAFWDLEIERRTPKAGKPYKNWAFNLRGMNHVKRIIKAITKEYIKTEDSLRESEGLPTARTPNDVQLGADADSDDTNR